MEEFFEQISPTIFSFIILIILLFIAKSIFRINRIIANQEMQIELLKKLVYPSKDSDDIQTPMEEEEIDYKNCPACSHPLNKEDKDCPGCGLGIRD